MRSKIRFASPVVRGAGRGGRLGFPTINLRLSSVPAALRHGIYACRVFWGRKYALAALHYGPRPVFRDTVSCEVHLIDMAVTRSPKRLTVEILARLRGIRNFRSPETLKKQIARDIAKTRTILEKRKTNKPVNQ